MNFYAIQEYVNLYILIKWLFFNKFTQKKSKIADFSFVAYILILPRVLEWNLYSSIECYLSNACAKSLAAWFLVVVWTCVENIHFISLLHKHGGLAHRKWQNSCQKPTFCVHHYFFTSFWRKLLSNACRSLWWTCSIGKHLARMVQTIQKWSLRLEERGTWKTTEKVRSRRIASIVGQEWLSNAAKTRRYGKCWPHNHLRKAEAMRKIRKDGKWVNNWPSRESVEGKLRWTAKQLWMQSFQMRRKCADYMHRIAFWNRSRSFWLVKLKMENCCGLLLKQAEPILFQVRAANHSCSNLLLTWDF